MENFKTPNFNLVSEILLWLIDRYDHNASLPTDIDTEQDRVIFIKSVAQFIASRAHVKLNTKRLYMADGYAVKELLKFTVILYNAMKEINNSSVSDDAAGDNQLSNNYYKNLTKADDLRAVREVSAQVTKCGANLYQLLSQEITLRQARQDALAQPLDISVIEKDMRDTIAKVEKEIKETIKKLDNVAADEANLEAKIKKRKNELERARKRLSTLQNVRPAFMDEFEKLEAELQVKYEEYLIKFRNINYLESQMDAYKRMETIKLNENEDNRKKIQNRLKEEEKNVILSDPFNENALSNDEDDILIDDDDDLSDESEEGEIPAGNHRRPGNPTNMRQNMMMKQPGRHGMYDDEDDSLTSSELDEFNSDVIMPQDGGDGLMSDDDIDDENDDDF